MDGPLPKLAEDLTDWFPSGSGRCDFSTLQQLTEIGAAKLSSRLWENAWEGEVTNDSFVAVRRGLLNRFQVPDLANTLRERGSR